MALHVRAVGCRNLLDVQAFGTQDPFCVLEAGGKKHKTEVHDNGGTQPTWGSVHDFKLKHMEGQELSVKVKNKNWTSSKLIGKCKIPLSHFQSGQVVDEWYPLQSEEKTHAGEINLRIQYEGGHSGEKHKDKDQHGYPEAVSVNQHGYPGQGHAPQGYPPQGHAPQDYSQQGYGPPGHHPPGYGAPAPGYGPPPGYGAPPPGHGPPGYGHGPPPGAPYGQYPGQGYGPPPGAPYGQYPGPGYVQGPPPGQYYGGRPQYQQSGGGGMGMGAVAAGVGAGLLGGMLIEDALDDDGGGGGDY